MDNHVHGRRDSRGVAWVRRMAGGGELRRVTIAESAEQQLKGDEVWA